MHDILYYVQYYDYYRSTSPTVYSYYEDTLLATSSEQYKNKY